MKYMLIQVPRSSYTMKCNHCCHCHFVATVIAISFLSIWQPNHEAQPLRQSQSVGQLLSKNLDPENQVSVNSEAEFLWADFPGVSLPTKRVKIQSKLLDGKMKGLDGKAKVGTTQGGRLPFLASAAVWLTPLLAPTHPVTGLRKGKWGPGELKITYVPLPYWREGEERRMELVRVDPGLQIWKLDSSDNTVCSSAFQHSSH